MYFFFNFQSLLTLLEENASPPLDPDSPKINYDDFMRVVQKASPAIAYV